MDEPVIDRTPDLARTRAVLLALGAVLVAMGGYRWGVPAFAWIAPVPFLLVLRTATTWRFRLVVLAVLTVASIVLVGKIITEPVPYVLAIPFALPAAIASWLVLLLTEHLRRRGGELAGVLALPALTALGEALQHSSMPLGTWSSLAVTQVDNVALLQLAALFGVAGIGFVMSLVASVVAMLLATPASRARARIAAAAAAVVGLALSWGAVRSYGRQGPRTVVAAAVTTDLGLGAGGLPDDAALAANTDALLARSELAAARGAVLIAWNEGATFVRPEQEPALISRGQALARARGVELVLAYAVVLSTAPLDLDNKYVWLGADGEVVETYQKHHPVPGEPSRRGRAPLVAHDHPWGRAAGAICYDYDFPSMVRAHAQLGAGLVVVPSSDWRGIDPYHTQITRIRAIEGGLSVLRPTRWATSAGYDAFGRTRASMPADEDHGGVMLVTLPTTPVWTLYAAAGDVPMVVGCGVLLLGLVWTARSRRGSPKPAPVATAT
ncbi:MAG: hypothetical protein KA297_14180 [Kofleriaceae bacterium]|nr:hypothetical protein [Kofleriaceae bacterium]